MQKIGKLADCGFSIFDLKNAQHHFEKLKYECEFVKLTCDEAGIEVEEAAVLVVRNGVEALLENNTASEMLEEQSKLIPDQKAFMYGRVVNKIARHNLCFDECGQEANYQAGKGTVVAYKDVALTSKLRERSVL